MRKTNNRRTHKWFGCMVLALTAVCVMLGWNLLEERKKESSICQSIVELGDIAYDEDFLETAQNIAGLRSLSPVLEVSVQLRIGDYTMSAVLTGVNLEECRMKVTQSWDTAAGEDPVLVLGEKSLSGLMDSNGHIISAGQLKKIMEDIDGQKIEYRIESEQETEEGNWRNCKVAGIAKEPEEGIYILYEQARALAGRAGEDTGIHKVLLTVQGEEQMERAKTLFASALST